MSDIQPTEDSFIMPGVTETTAAMQFFVEAMKANTAVLERVSTSQEGIQAEQKEQIRLMIDVRERVIKLENNQVGRRLDELKDELKAQAAEIEALQAERLEREGGKKTVGLLWKNFPQFVSLFMGAVAIVAIILKMAGKI